MKNLIQPFRLVFMILILATLISTGCKKDLNSSISTNGTDGIAPFPLSWETANYMPTPRGTTILVPWANGSIKGFSSDIWYDYKSSDGWVLVYNVFNTTSIPANPWFALYNRYRGLLRIYVYVTTNGFVASDYLTSGLNLAPNVVSSSMLNYIGQDIVNVTKNQTAISQMESTQLATGTWYASQYEIAYDPKIATSTYQQLGLNWTLKYTSVSKVSLGGDAVGTLNGTISTPAQTFNLGNTLMNGGLELTGLAVLANNKGSAADFSKNTLGLPGKAFGAIQDALTSGLQGVVKNLFSGIFGGSSANTQEVNLTMNATINLIGSITQSGAFIPDPGLGVGISGISNSQFAQGYIPGYNNPMGVFNLSSIPKINIHTITNINYTIHGTDYNSDFSVDNSFLNSITSFNPALINTSASGASIQNFRSQVVLFPNQNYSSNQIWGNSEIIGTYTVFTNPFIHVTYSDPEDNMGFDPTSYKSAVRIIFDVVPNNGALKSTIVKTFLANIVNN